MERIGSEVKKIDVLIHCAGIVGQGFLENQPIEEFGDVIDTNLTAIARVTKYALPLLKAAAEPLIIILSSGSAHAAKPGLGAYCASKFGLRGLTESWHWELKQHGIRVTMVSPGKVDTTIHEGSPVYAQRSKMLKAEDIAQCIAFIISRGKNVWIKDIILRPFLLE